MSYTKCCAPSAFEDKIVQCPESITIHTLNLEASTEYRVKIVSAIFGIIEVDAETDANGYLVIDIVDLPEGFMTQYSGTFNISVYPMPSVDEEADACEPISLLLARKYEVVSLSIESGTAVKSKVACPLPSVI